MKLNIEQPDIEKAIVNYLESIGVLPNGDRQDLSYTVDMSFTKGRLKNGLSCEVNMDIIQNKPISEPEIIKHRDRYPEDNVFRDDLGNPYTDDHAEVNVIPLSNSRQLSFDFVKEDNPIEQRKTIENSDSSHDITEEEFEVNQKLDLVVSDNTIIDRNTIFS